MNTFRQRVAALAASDRWRDWGCVALIAALAATMLFPVLRGDWPIGHDHPVHIFRIWQLRETLLHHGLPWSWSHRWFAGYPQNVIYPIGADVFVLLIQLLSLGMLKLEVAYGIAFLIFFFFYGYAVFFFVRRALGSRVAGLIATLFSLTDPGNNDTGGWFYTVDMGVWASPFGMVPALFAFVWIADLLANPKPRAVVLVAVSVALALLCHPVHLIYFGLGIPLLCACRFLSDEATAWKRALPFLSAALGLAFLIASIWLIPYFSVVKYAAEIGGNSTNLTKIGDAFAGGTFFTRMHYLASAAGLIGAVFLLRARRTLPLFMSLFIFVILVVSSSSFAALFGDEVAHWIRKHIIAQRLWMLVKPCWYGATAFVFVSSWRAVRQWHGNGNEPPSSENGGDRGWLREAAFVSLLVLFVAPILVPSLSTFFHWEVRRPTQWNSERANLSSRKALILWLNEEIAQKQGFFRVAYGFDQDDHDLADLAMKVPCPFYKIYHTPTGHFKYDIQSGTNAALRATNVRFAVARHALPPRPDFCLLKVFRKDLWVYEFTDWNPKPFELQGSGTVETIQFGDEDIVLRADDKARGTLRLNVSYFPKWQATRDQVPLPITTVALPGVKDSGFMQVELAPGTYRFHFRRALSDYIGTVLCVVGLSICLLLANLDRVRGWWARRRAPSGSVSGGSAAVS